jgi:hypothetical protein
MGISAVALTAGAFCGDQRAAAEKAVDNNVAPWIISAFAP